MIKTPKARTFIRRWVDASIFVDGRSVSQHEISNNVSNYISLYDFVLAHLSRESMCVNFTGNVINDSDIFLASSAFVTSAGKRRTANRNIDLYAVVNTIVAEGTICDLPFTISSDVYDLETVKNMYLDLRNDSVEVSKSFLVTPQTTRRKMPNDSISLKTVIDNYAKNILGIDNLPTASIVTNFADPDAVTVEIDGLEADGVTALGAGDRFYIWVEAEGVTTALNSGNATAWGTAVSGADDTFLGTIGVENITGTYDDFTFEKNPAIIVDFANPITFIYRVYEDFGLATEKFTHRIESTIPVLAGGTR